MGAGPPRGLWMDRGEGGGPSGSAKITCAESIVTKAREVPGNDGGCEHQRFRKNVEKWGGKKKDTGADYPSRRDWEGEKRGEGM